MQEAYMELVMAEERGDPVDQLLMGVVRTLNAQQQEVQVDLHRTH